MFVLTYLAMSEIATGIVFSLPLPLTNSATDFILGPQNPK